MTVATTSPLVYAAAAELYREAGWTGVLPLPAGKKALPPVGFTGADGAYPDERQVLEWCRSRPDANIGVRMPGNVVGIDVDQYHKPKKDGTVVVKRGAEQLAALEAELGVALPRTWVSSARPYPSGVRWFRVPRGQVFVGEISDSIEILQRHHRYAVVWPSTNPETGGTIYQWVTPDGEIADRPPRPDDLAELPVEWVDRLRARTEPATPREPIPPRPIPPGAPSRSTAVQNVLDARTAWTQGGRHPQARDLSIRLARLEHLGHPGATEALELVGDEFCAAVDGEHGRAPMKEWLDLLNGARGLVAGTMSTTPDYGEILAERDQRRRRDHEIVAEWTAVAAPDDSRGREPAPIGDEAERTTWEPVDLGPVLAGENVRVTPDVGRLEDGGVGLFYLGRINGLFGESGSGKSWVGTAVAAQELIAGYGVLYIDLEDDAAGVIGRLRELGVPPSVIAEHFVYVHPDLPLRPAAFDLLAQVIAARRVRLVILDSLGEVMSLEGAKDEDGPVTAFMQRFPRWLARLGPAVVPIDHVPKAKDAPLDYAIGSQRKRGAVTGALYRVDQFHKMAQGRSGAVKLTVAKDRLGTRTKGSVAAEIEFDARTDGEMVATFTAPNNAGDDGKFRPTTLMARVSEWLEANAGEHSQNAVIGSVKGNRDAKRAALARLVEEGFVSMESHGQAHEYGHLRRFS